MIVPTARTPPGAVAELFCLRSEAPHPTDSGVVVFKFDDRTRPATRHLVGVLTRLDGVFDGAVPRLLLSVASHRPCAAGECRAP